MIVIMIINNKWVNDLMMVIFYGIFMKVFEDSWKIRFLSFRFFWILLDLLINVIIFNWIVLCRISFWWGSVALLPRRWRVSYHSFFVVGTNGTKVIFFTFQDFQDFSGFLWDLRCELLSKIKDRISISVLCESGRIISTSEIIFRIFQDFSGFFRMFVGFTLWIVQ